MKYIFPIIALLMLSCKGETETLQTDTEKIDISVRNYFFMGDSVDVECTVIDTISSKELDGILETVEENLRLIQLDIDTLNSMIDEKAYANLEKRNSLYPESIEIKMAQDELILAQYNLKMEQLKAKKTQFQNSNRLYMHLRRSTSANVSGYGVQVHYKMGEEEADLQVLMDADFDVVD